MRLKIFLGLLITATIAYCGFWYYAASKAPELIQLRLQELEASNIQLAHDKLSISGFPFRFIASFAAPVATLGPEGTGTTWQSQSMNAYAQPWDPDHIILSSGSSELFWGDKILGAEKMRTSIVTTDESFARLSLELTNTQASNKGTGPLLTAKTMGFHLRNRPEDAAKPSGSTSLLKPVLMDLAYGAQDLKFHDSGGSEDGLRVLDELMFVATLRGEQLPAYSVEELSAWRDSGGTLEISSLKLKIAGVEMDASGSISLDQQLRPLGALSAKVPSPEAAMTVIESVVTMGNDTKRAMKTSFQLLERFADGEGIPIALTAQDGGLWLGPLQLATIDPIIR